MTASTPAEMLAALLTVVEAAGRETLRFYDAPATLTKADGSPVTAADEAAERLILPALRALTPEIPVISEEEAAAGLSPAVAGREFWLVDPLDGTREFIRRNGEFTVNIALIRDGRPALGLVHVPVSGVTYLAAGPGTAIRRVAEASRPIAVRVPPPAGLTVIGSRSHGNDPAIDTFLGRLGRPIAERRTAGSSLKLCLVAEGGADLYPRFGTTMEWDIAAGHAILLAAGGRVETLDGASLGYGKPEYRNPNFAAYGNWR